MLVRDLIKALQAFPENVEVFVDDPDGTNTVRPVGFVEMTQCLVHGPKNAMIWPGDPAVLGDNLRTRINHLLLIA